MITEETVHIKGIPKKLIIFLHGYIDSSPSLDRRLSVLYDTLDDFAIHLPQAPVICEIHENKRQWYSMHRFDPNDDRKLVPTMEECVAFYNRMTLGLKNAYDYLMPYIEQSMAEYNLTPDDVYVCGFSQGAMVALYLGLMYPERFAGIVSFSGILAAAPYLHKHVVSTPDVLLLTTSSAMLRWIIPGSSWSNSAAMLRLTALKAGSIWLTTKGWLKPSPLSAAGLSMLR